MKNHSNECFRVGVSDPLGTAPAAALAAAGLTSLEQLGAALQEQTRRLEQQQQQLAPNKFLPTHRASYHGQRPHAQNTLDSNAATAAAQTGAHMLAGSAENLVGRVLHEQVRTTARPYGHDTLTRASSLRTAPLGRRPRETVVAMAMSFTSLTTSSLSSVAGSSAPPHAHYTQLRPRADDEADDSSRRNRLLHRQRSRTPLGRHRPSKHPDPSPL